MNLDALSIALAQISYTVQTLSKKNIKTATSEIATLVSTHGFEAERHLYRSLITNIDFTVDSNNAKNRDSIHVQYLSQEILSLISKPNFVTLICYSFDTAISQKSLKVTSSLFSIICKLFKLSRTQEILFTLALEHSTNQDLASVSTEYIRQKLPELLRFILESDNGAAETGLTDLPVEALHSLLVHIKELSEPSSISSSSTLTTDLLTPTKIIDPLIKPEHYEQLVVLLRKEYPKERLSVGHVILAPLLYPTSFDLTPNQLLSDSSNLSTAVWQMDASLADVVIEMGYSFTSSIEDCRNALVQFGVQEIKPLNIARILGAMAKTHTGLTENTIIYNLNSQDSNSNEKSINQSQTWNVEIFVHAVNDLAPNMNWKDVLKELDYNGFIIKDRQSLILIVNAFKRALADGIPIDLFYTRWHNAEGQLSWFAQAIRNSDIFCFGDYPAHPVNIECLKHLPDDSKETWTWRSLNLLECLLRISESGLYQPTLELFKIGLQRCAEVILLGLLQLPNIWNSLKQELLQILIPLFLPNSPNSNAILNYIWNSQHHTTALRTSLLTSMADWYNRSSESDQQQRLSRVLEVVQDLKTLPVLLNAQPMPFIIDLACLASRRGYLKLDKWLSDKLRDHQETFVQNTIQFLRKKVPQLSAMNLRETNNGEITNGMPSFKPLINYDTIMIILTVLHAATSSVNADLAQEIVTMLNNASSITAEQYRLTQATNNPTPPPPLQTAVSSPALSQQTQTSSGLMSVISRLNNGTPTGVKDQENQPPSMYQNVANTNQLFNPSSQTNYPPVSVSPSNMFHNSTQSANQLLEPTNSRQMSLPLLQQQQQQMFSTQTFLQSPTGSNIIPHTSTNISRSSGNLNALANDQLLGQHMGNTAGNNISGVSTSSHLSNSEIADVDIYFKRLYSKTNNPPPISVDDFLDIFTRCRDSSIQRERDVFQSGVRNLFDEYKFYPQYPERELHLTAQLFGGLVERNLLPPQIVSASFRAIGEGLKKPPSANLFIFAITALERCKLRLRENSQYCHLFKTAQSYHDIPANLKDYIEYGALGEYPPSQMNNTQLTSLQQQQPRTLTPTPQQPTLPSNNIQQSPSPLSNIQNTFPRINSTQIPNQLPTYSTTRANTTTGVIPSVAQSANISSLLRAPSYEKVRVAPPPEGIQDKVSFTFNNLSFANLSQKADELKESMQDDKHWQWVAQYLVMKRASIEPNFHTLYAGFVMTLNVQILIDTVLAETHRNIKILLLGDKQMNNIPDRALLKNLGHWLGIITIGKNKPILAIDLDLKSLTIEAYHTGSQELLYVVPFIAKILESCTRSKIFQPPNPWLMGIMSVLAEMHQSPEFKLNLKFEIEVLCRQLQIQLNDLPIPHILQNKEYFEKLDKQLSRPVQLSTSHIPLGMSSFHPLQQQNQSTKDLISSVQGQQQLDQQQRQQSLALNDPAIIQQSPSYQSHSSALQPTPVAPSSVGIQNATSATVSSNVSGAPSSANNASAPVPSPKYKLSDFKSSIFQSLSTMLEINPNLLLFQHHPRLKTYIHSPIEQAINESLTTVQRSLKVATSAAETIARKDFMFNPDEQQLRTSARNMVAYLSSGLVLITARPALQDQIQTYIRNHLQTVLGVTQNSSETNANANTTASSSTTSGNPDLNAQTREMINQAANEIAQSNIELCCCLLQRITISRAIQHIDTRLASDIEQRQRTRLEQKQWNVDPYNYNFQTEKLPEQIRLKYGPLNSHQLAIYEDFVHYIPGFKPSDNEKREPLQMEDNSPSLWDRLISDIEQVIQLQVNSTYSTPLQRLIDSLTVLRTNLQTLPSAAQAALATVLNTIVYNLLECYTQQAQTQDSEGATRFRDVHMAVLKLLIDIRLQISVITKQLTKCWLDCPNELKFNVHAVNTLIRNRLLDCRQVDAHISQLIDSGNNPALHFAVHFIRSCLIEQPACSDSDISFIIESLHRISLIGKQPAEAVRDLLEIIRLNYASSSVSSNDNSTSTSSATATTPSSTTPNSATAATSTTNETNTTNSVNKFDRLAIISLSVINSGSKYLTNDEIETTTIAAKAKLILSEWVSITITQTNRIAQQQAFQTVFNQMNIQGIFRSDDTIAKFLRMTIQLCVNSVYDILRSTPANQQPHYVRCHQGIDSLCRFLSLLTTHTSDVANFAARIHLINRILGILAALCQVDHDDQQGDQFNPIAYQRIILNLFQEATASENTNDLVMYYIYLAFTNVLHLLRPQRVTGFSFAWLEIVAHRTFMSKLLAPNTKYIRQTQNMYALLLVDALRLVAPFIRSGEHTPSFQVYFKGVLKTFMLLLHDFPEFLCEYYYQFCDALPLVAHQLRNIVLSAFPKQMRCPDPFLVNFKVDMLNDISYSPFIAYNYSNNIQPPKFKANLDSYLRTRAPVTFLSELRSCLQQGADPGSHYNIRMLNALVLYVASQAITTIQQKGSQVLVGSITHSAPMDIFQNLAVDLDTEGRYIFLNAMANHLRFPNTHTHYFSYTLLYLFAEANSESLQEQIVRVLLERLVANRPHPWGLLITFLELVRNPHLKLWSREFMNISPDVKRLLHTLTRGFPQFQTTKT